MKKHLNHQINSVWDKLEKNDQRKLTSLHQNSNYTWQSHKDTHLLWPIHLIALLIKCFFQNCFKENNETRVINCFIDVYRFPLKTKVLQIYTLIEYINKLNLGDQCKKCSQSRMKNWQKVLATLKINNLIAQCYSFFVFQWSFLDWILSKIVD